MIAKIISGKSFYNVASYNQNKIENGTGVLLHSQLLRNATPEGIQKTFESFKNERVNKPVFHVSLSFSAADKAKLSNEKITTITKDYLKEMGYDKQPYLVYRHNDTAHPHVHILTTRINLETQKKISHDFEFQKSKQVTQSLEKKYDLTIADNRIFSKQTLIEDIKEALHKSKPESIKDLNQALEKLGSPYRAEESAKGMIYYELGDSGKRVGKSYKSSLFKESGIDKKSLDNHFSQNLQTPKIPKENPITPKSQSLKQGLQAAISNPEPLTPTFDGKNIRFPTANPDLQKQLESLPPKAALDLSKMVNRHKGEYEKAENPTAKQLITSLAGDEIDEYLNKENKQQTQQQRIRR